MAIKENSKAELKIFKAKLKDIAAAFQVHSKRLENAYLDNIVWTTKEWQDYYIKHPFLSRFGSKLIWIFDDKKTGIIANDELIDFNGNNLALADFSEVKLWHPIYSEVKIVQNWRNFILEQEIKQPFKQAYREIYKVTDAEIGTSTYSNRFAAHILYQHQFNALARIRNWQYKLQGGFDSHNVPTKSIPKYNLKAEYWVTPIPVSYTHLTLPTILLV